MPIRFRCSRCNRLLGIARRKAGLETKCPHCGSTITVPNDAEEDAERSQYDEIDELVNPVTGAVQAPALSTPPLATRPASQPAPRAPVRPAAEPWYASHPETERVPASERPLFERDVDAVLGTANPAANGAETAKPKPVATAGIDALSLGPERTHIVISSQKATALAVIAVVLLALSFGAGFLMGSR